MSSMRAWFLLVLFAPFYSCLHTPLKQKAIADDAIDSVELVLEALEAGQDDVARRVLMRMRAVHTDKATTDWITGVEVILEGRRLIQGVSLSLRIRTEDVNGASQRTLFLVAETQEDLGVSLHMTPPILRCRRSWLDSQGHGGSEDESVALDWFETLTLQGIGATEIPIMRLDGARGPIAAMRERWDLEMHYCFIVHNGQRFGVDAPLVQGSKRYLLANHLSLGELTPEPLVELLGSPKSPRIEQVVERAVRIPEDQMGTALDQLTPLLLRLSNTRLELLAPVLAWLAEGSGESYYHPEDTLKIPLGAGAGFKLRVAGEMLAPRFLRSELQAWRPWLSLRQKSRNDKPKSNLKLPHVWDGFAKQGRP